MSAAHRLTAMVLAGGGGSRFRSARPKVVHPMLGRPMLLWALQAAREAGSDRIVVVVSPEIEADVRALVEPMPDVSLALQPIKNGTGGAVQFGLPAVDGEGDLLVVCGDTPLLRGTTLATFVADHRRAVAAATVLSAVPADAGRYGRIVRDSHGCAQGIVEFADATEGQKKIAEVNTGVWAFDLTWLRNAIAGLRPDNAQAELYLTDLLASAYAQKRSHAWVAQDFGEFGGINTRQEFADAWSVLQQRVLDQLMAQGVTLIGREFRIEPTVTVGRDSVLYAPVTLTGATVLGESVVVETGCAVHDAQLATGVHAKPYTIIEGARVGAAAVLGPFARLRPDTELAEDVHIGNFVELKKTRVAQGSKINHLSYVGDAEVGAGVNIGAGTITCNYDGVLKHRTVIGEGAFIGSNTSLVAPVTVGARAITGAGSVITRSVPDEALAVERSDQREVAGYGRRRTRKAESR